MNIGETWSISLLPIGHDQKSPERGNVANASGKEVDFARSLLDKQHEFNGTSLEGLLWDLKSPKVAQSRLKSSKDALGRL